MESGYREFQDGLPSTDYRTTLLCLEVQDGTHVMTTDLSRTPKVLYYSGGWEYCINSCIIAKGAGNIVQGAASIA
jgi:hypothetical protein